MQRLRQVMQVWDWLPAFRAIAETEHLTQASSELHVSPPALSRTLKLLEEQIGQPLFDREGRSLVLNPAGRRLLVAVRSAMRLVHDAVVTVEEPTDRVLTVASSGIFTVTGLVPTIHRLLASHPHVRPRVQTTISEDAAAELLRGDLDVLFTSTAWFREGLATRTLLRVTAGVWCGPHHPLHGTTGVRTATDLAGQAFVAPPRDGRGQNMDGWPGDWPRHVAVEVDRQAVGIALCASTPLLAVLPDALGATYPNLWRLGLEVPARTAILAIYRDTIGESGPVEAIVEHAEHVLHEGTEARFIQTL